MNQRHDRPLAPDLAAQAMQETTAPAAHDHAHGHDDEHHHDHEHAFEWPEMLRIAVVALAAVAVWIRLWEPFPAVRALLQIVGGDKLIIPFC
ncbi:hypothetical protein [Enterobacter kobei]|uniref:hypothetical protein n=1 Tax=Enterobacter kobei TaxID=208224 RepID=UPI0038901159